MASSLQLGTVPRTETHLGTQLSRALAISLLLNPSPQTLPISTRRGWDDYEHPTNSPHPPTATTATTKGL